MENDLLKVGIKLSLLLLPRVCKIGEIAKGLKVLFHTGIIVLNC